MSEEGFELEFVRQAFESNWIAPLGPQVEAFEKEFAEYIGIKYATAVSTGTAALHLSLILLQVKAGDEVFCSSFTFAASANPIVYVGAKPVFIDSDPYSWNMDPNLLELELKRGAKIGKLPKALMVVDLYGQCAEWDAITRICADFNLPIIEDAAEALGATYKGKKAGNFGLLGAFSFNGNKIITTSNGGMLVSNNGDLIKRAHFLATQARDPAPHYQHSEIGFNYRLSNILAGIGRGQLKVLERRIARRREIFNYYQQELATLPGIGFMPELPESRSTRWLTCITVNPQEFGASRDVIQAELKAYNIESRPLWKPMHLQPVFSNCRYIGGEVSAHLFETGLCLPSGTNMKQADLETICSIIKSVQKNP
jgi:pyridoxal phosphate-dependent aminotransferase EpsN